MKTAVQLWCLVWGALCALVAGALLWWGITAARNTVQEEAARAAERLSTAISGPLWQVNVPQVAAAVRAELKDPAIARVEIVERREGELESLLDVGGPIALSLPWRWFLHDLPMTEHGVSHEEEDIGVVRVWGSIWYAVQGFKPLAYVVVYGSLLLALLGVLLIRAFGRSNDLRVVAEDASRTKSTFLANMSHELRTPLNGVVGLVDVLLEQHPSIEQRKSLTVIKSCAETLHRIINDVLDLTKAESGKIELDIERFDVSESMRQVIESLTPSMMQRELIVVTEARGLPREILGDQHRLRQILFNLLGNAIKFTPRHGSIIVLGEYRPTDAARGDLVIHVADTGIGIASDKLAMVFEPFTQADLSTTRQFGGTGLGLTITKRLVETMGGSIEVRSRERRGTRFTVTVPVEVVGQDLALDVPAPPLKEISFEGMRVLLVEDNPVNQTVAKKLLERRGIVVEVASNGREGVSRTEVEIFDVILMDLHMPIMNGPEAIAEIRRSTSSNRNVPIVVLTADVLNSKGSLEASGVDGFCAKPFKIEHLLTEMRSAILRRTMA